MAIAALALTASSLPCFAQTARNIEPIRLDPKNQHYTVRLPAGRYGGEWLDTRTGKTSALGAFTSDGGTHEISSPQFADGIALRLRRDIY